MERGGQVIAVSAEPMFLAPETAKVWSLPFEVIGDPTHKLLKLLREKAGFKVVIAGHGGDPGYNTVYFRTHKAMGRYKQGAAQPGLIILRKTVDDSVFSWAISPRLMNLNGASDRPKIPELWEKTKIALDQGGKVEGKVKMNSKLDRPEFRKVTV